MRRTIILAALAAVAILATGCGISPTPPMKINAATLTDGLAYIDKHGAKVGDPLVKQLLANAQTNENIMAHENPIGPEQRIPVDQILTMGEVNRKQAVKDASEGGTWTMFGNTALDLVAFGLTVFGLGSAGSWVKKQKDVVNSTRKQLVKANTAAEDYRVKAKSFSEKAVKYEARFRTVVKGVASALGLIDGAAAKTVKASIGKKADDAAEPKADFDEAVDAVINTTS